jgi:hypothetical protein
MPNLREKIYAAFWEKFAKKWKWRSPSKYLRSNMDALAHWFDLTGEPGHHFG